MHFLSNHKCTVKEDTVMRKHSCTCTCTHCMACNGTCTCTHCMACNYTCTCTSVELVSMCSVINIKFH